ncbi:MAG TPA: MFS transporter [Caulobacteraceae bacterium]|nr:MFS transporter [Caulobacteraceae bacterium]
MIASEGRAADRGLWGHRDFLRLWAAQAVSTFGARIAREGLPMAAVVTLHAGPAATGLFAALRLGSQGLMGLVAGHLADRLPKRSLLIAADLARALVLTLVPLAALVGRLSLTEIFLAGVLMGAFGVVFDVADHAFLPSLLKPAQVIEGNAKLGATEAMAEVGGPALYGAIFSVVAPPIGIGVTALTYLASALFLSRIRPPRSAAEPGKAPGQGIDLAAGFRLVLAHSLVRPLWLAEMTRNFFGGFFAALYLLFALRVLRLTPFMLGLTVACGGLGGILGAALAPRLARTAGVGPTILFAGAAGAATQVLVPAAGGAPLAAMGFLCAAQFFGDGLMTAADVNAVTLRQTVIPPDQLGRAGGAFASGQGFMGVAGALGGGWVATLFDPREALYVAAAGMVAATLFVAASPLRGLRRAG